MPYDAILAERMRPLLLPRSGVTEKNMFGGIAFLVYGNMSVGIWKDALIVRTRPEEAAVQLQRPHVRPMDITGKPMKGWLLVEPERFVDDTDLLQWIEMGYAFAIALPPKK